MESLNRMAIELVDEAIDFAPELGIGVHHLDNDAVVLDFGVASEGGFEAGLLLCEIGTGGLATVTTRLDEVAGASLPHVELVTDHPHLSLLGSQRSGWALSVDGFEALAGGPAGLLRDDAADRFPDHEEAFDLAVLAVEADALPDEAVAEHVAGRIGVPTSGLYLPVVPTGSRCGGVSVAARAAEVALVRLAHLGYDPRHVATAVGCAPVPPLAPDDRTALARANDALAQGGRVHLTVREGWDRFDELPFGATDARGRSFGEILEEVDWRLGKVDEGLFAPAQVTVDVRGGPTHAVGDVEEDRLAANLGL